LAGIETPSGVWVANQNQRGDEMENVDKLFSEFQNLDADEMEEFFRRASLFFEEQSNELTNFNSLYIGMLMERAYIELVKRTGN
jgi:uncharacterized tellurite resistance protein B-like protein